MSLMTSRFANDVADCYVAVRRRCRGPPITSASFQISDDETPYFGFYHRSKFAQTFQVEPPVMAPVMGGERRAELQRSIALTLIVRWKVRFDGFGFDSRLSCAAVTLNRSKVVRRDAVLMKKNISWCYNRIIIKKIVANHRRTSTSSCKRTLPF